MSPLLSSKTWVAKSYQLSIEQTLVDAHCSLLIGGCICLVKCKIIITLPLKEYYNYQIELESGLLG